MLGALPVYGNGAYRSHATYTPHCRDEDRAKNKNRLPTTICGGPSHADHHQGMPVATSIQMKMHPISKKPEPSSLTSGR